MGENRSDLPIAKHRSLRRHDQVVILAQNFDLAHQSVKYDLDHTVGVSLGPEAFGQGRGSTLCTSLPLSTMASRTISLV